MNGTHLSTSNEIPLANDRLSRKKKFLTDPFFIHQEPSFEFLIDFNFVDWLTSLLLLAALYPGVRGQKRSKSLFHSLQPENNPKAQPRSSAVAELFVF